ncbi:hypothetical protein [Paraburkholderia dioscoreae]|uniref:Uncharacterized protein n=1 Tax=Paraburkholderia dioscoreae TaxID=2604047 RepID=A0A5Q4ZGN3_9BURK|nr:hypothetical protein [Paraburkholderia dioscoreae]VVD30911.1 conserved protein of unknown function [Paraburkholderia dioscoreae]
MTTKTLPPVPAGVSMYFYMKFALGGEEFGDEWYRFPTLEDLPPCLKHDYPTRELQFRVPPNCTGFESVTIELQSALDTMPPEDRLHLNPARWSKVKRDLSNGWCYTPYMGLETGAASLTDGRHRIVAMMKLLQLEYAPFSVPREHVDAVRAQLKTR